jgi:GntR family transcriptional regulator
VAPGERVITLSRLRFVDDDLAGCSDAHIPAELGGGIEDALAQEGSIYGYLESRFGYGMYRGWSELSVEAPPLAVAERIGLNARPLLLRHSARMDSARLGRPVEYVTAWLRPDVVRLRFRYGSPVPPGREGTSATTSEEG